MPVYRVTYSPDSGQPDDLVDAERYEPEGDRSLVFRRTVFVVGKPRDVVVRRVPAGAVLAIHELSDVQRAPQL